MAYGGVVALVSGGVESCCVVARLLAQGATVHPVYVRCGLVWERAEGVWLSRWLSRLRHPRLRRLVTLELPVRSLYGPHWSLSGRGVPSAKTADTAVYLPGRNVLLLGLAAVYAARQRCSTLAIGTLAGNPFGDASPRFFKQCAACVSAALSTRLQINRPLRTSSKSQLVKTFSQLPLPLTFSCLCPRGLRHCGQCNKCAERRRAFRLARVPDLTPYVQ